MTRTIKPPSRNYDTFNNLRSPLHADDTNGRPIGEPNPISDSDKSRTAAFEAQRLATDSSWADNFTPSDTITPVTSMIGDDGSQYGERSNGHPPDPPPLYTPSDTASNASTSPILTRSEDQSVGFVPVHFHNPSSSFIPSQPRHGDEDIERNLSMIEIPETPLLSRGLPASVSQNDCTKVIHFTSKDNYRRRRRLFWSILACVACLWLVLPVIYSCNSNQRTHTGPSNPDDSNLDKSPVPAWPTPDREYRRHETSQAISGSFKLYDLLELRTTSGSITAKIELQAGDKPAELHLATQSGSINVQISNTFSSSSASSSTSNRTLLNQLSTSSGSVSGSLLHGNGGKTEVSTTSGGISLDIHVVGASGSDRNSILRTTTHSASQTITIHSSSSFAIDENAIRAIQASHQSLGAGSLTIRYPGQWAGEVHAKAQGGGSLIVRGQGLQYKNGDGSGGEKDIYAWRGAEKGAEARLVEVLGGPGASVAFDC